MNNINEVIDLLERIGNDDLPLVSITNEQKKMIKKFVEFMKTARVIYWDDTKPLDIPKTWKYEKEQKS